MYLFKNLLKEQINLNTYVPKCFRVQICVASEEEAMVCIENLYKLGFSWRDGGKHTSLYYAKRKDSTKFYYVATIIQSEDGKVLKHITYSRSIDPENTYRFKDIVFDVNKLLDWEQTSDCWQYLNGELFNTKTFEKWCIEDNNLIYYSSEVSEAQIMLTGTVERPVTEVDVILRARVVGASII